jgi:RNA polymerase sigma factor (sigma-70 family)
MAKRVVVVTEDDLEQQFRDDKQSAVQLLESEYREHIWRYIKSICRYFFEDDIHDVYQKTFCDFIRCVKRPDFEPHRPLRLLQHIAKLRAIDCIRRRKSSRIRNAGELIEALSANLTDTKVRLDWSMIAKEEWPRFRQALDRAVDELPPKQRNAALAYLEVYEIVDEERAYRALAERIGQITGKNCTSAQAYDNWRAARRAIAAKLRREQFHLLIEE